MPLMLEAIAKVRAAVGDQVAVRSPGTGPFALASYLIGTQQWLCEVGMIEAGMAEANEEAVQHALDVATERLIRFGKACWDAGADIIHCGDSLASCDMISPRTYERFALPCQQRVFQAWKEHGITGSILHICGNSTKVLDCTPRRGGLIEIDNMVDFAVARERIGDRVTLVGTCTPSTICSGQSRIGTRGRRTLHPTGRAEEGFILGPAASSPDTHRSKTCRRWFASPASHALSHRIRKEHRESLSLSRRCARYARALAAPAIAREHHVSATAADAGDGSPAKPFSTISDAADVAQPGDVILVHEGVYRERVTPPRGGESDEKRIVYQAAEGETVVIKGSEIVRDWQPHSGEFGRRRSRTHSSAITTPTKT